MPAQINAPDFDLAATLLGGQAFRWRREADGWFVGVVGHRVRRLRQTGTRLEGDIDQRYLALDRSLTAIVETFPSYRPLQQAVKRHWGLRVLRQEPWETLASFIASSTKQIVQIRQIVANLARCFGEPVGAGEYSFPSANVLARRSLSELHACKLGFRAKYLLTAAQSVDTGKLDLAALARMELPRAREELLKLNGVGDKIANCTLLFACGHDAAFPIDVWVARALQRRQRRPDFGPYAGWAQQYLFHAERERARARPVLRHT